MPIRVVARGDPGGMSLSESHETVEVERGYIHEAMQATPLFAWLAAHHAEVCIVGAVRFDSDDMNCEMVLPRAPDDLTSEMTLNAFRGSSVFIEQDGACGWYACRSLRVVSQGIEIGAEEMTTGELEETLFGAGLPCVDRLGELRRLAPLNGEMRRDVERAEHEALPRLARAAGHLSSKGAHGVPIAGLREVQEQMLALYGRLEPDRALVWTTEELGELAQAVRRNESTVRLEEELGQLTTWCFCLANILRIDVAKAVSEAYETELTRQMRKYGMPRPYGLWPKS